MKQMIFVSSVWKTGEGTSNGLRRQGLTKGSMGSSTKGPLKDSESTRPRELL